MRTHNIQGCHSRLFSEIHWLGICSQAGSLRRSSTSQRIPSPSTAAAAQWREAVGIAPQESPLPDEACGTFHHVLAFQRVEGVQSIHPEGIPVLSLLTLPRAPTPEEAAHLDTEPRRPSPSAGAIQVRELETAECPSHQVSTRLSDSGYRNAL